jgi:hypothetical protein
LKLSGIMLPGPGRRHPEFGAVLPDFEAMLPEF